MTVLPEPDAPPCPAGIGAHRSWLLQLVRSRLSRSPLSGDPLVEDVVQEVALAAMRSSDRPTGGEELKHWLCRVALRQCSLLLRKSLRSQAVIDGAGERLQIDAPGVVDPIDWLIADEDQLLARDAMRRIDPILRDLLSWKYLEQLSYQAIAERLGVTQHAAEYRVFKARKALRNEMTKLGLAPRDKP